MARKGKRPARKSGVLHLVERASRQAHYALLERAQKLKINFNGHPTGVRRIGNKLFLYEDIGVGCVRARLVRRVKPLNVEDYLPSPAAAR